MSIDLDAMIGRRDGVTSETGVTDDASMPVLDAACTFGFCPDGALVCVTHECSGITEWITLDNPAALTLGPGLDGTMHSLEALAGDPTSLPAYGIAPVRWPATGHVRVRLWVDFSSLRMMDGDEITFLSLLSAASPTELATVRVIYIAGVTYVDLEVLDDRGRVGAAWMGSVAPGVPHSVEIHIGGPSGGAARGAWDISIDGATPVGSTDVLDNDVVVTQLNGVAAGFIRIDVPRGAAGPRGTIRVDEVWATGDPTVPIGP